MAQQNAFGLMVKELCLRRGIVTQTQLVDKMEAAGYGEKLGVGHLQHKVSRAFQRGHERAIKATLVAAIIDTLELKDFDSEWRELYEALDEAGRQQWQDERDEIARKSIRSGSEAHDSLLPFYG